MGDQPIDEYYITMKGLWEELLLYQPFTIDLEKQRQQREQFQEHGESLSIVKESSALLSTPSNRGGCGGYTGGRGSYGRGNYVVPVPIVPCDDVPHSPNAPPSPAMSCEEGPSRVPITTVRGSMPTYAQYHRTFPRKKVPNVESDTVTTVESVPNQSSSLKGGPLVNIEPVAIRTRHS
ncbi:hypothetical protein IFM89_036253 [Coptis chinensis]|uniref:Uncharacterized protein n=1 Tax=Coptis chinensis TaxID=261450 RepID=A0A835HJE1_9MAGN|nr:hypothetical protein IFM89_036253 [Coptis chinensis]